MDFLLLADVGLLQAVGNTASTYPKATFATVMVFLGGLAKVIGSERLKAFGAWLVSFIGVKWPGDSTAETLTLATFQRLLNEMVDRLLAAEVAPEKVEAFAKQALSDYGAAENAILLKSISAKCAKAKPKEAA